VKILYNQSHLKRLLLLGIGNLLIGVASLFISSNWYLVGLSGLGIVYLIQYFYTKNRVLMELTPDYIIYNGFFKKKTIRVDTISSYKSFAGEHTITSIDTTVLININLFDKATQLEIKAYFDSLQTKLET
jgi:hypothetical protein